MFMSIDHFPAPRIEHLSLWPMAHWGITYETGFVFRGLMGTIATGIFGNLSFNAIYNIFMVFWISLGALFSYINIKIYKHNPNFVSLIFILFLISQPSCIRWWGTPSLFGRVDIVLVIITFIIGSFVVKCKKKIMLVTALLLSIVALLTHEGFVVLFSSTIFALMMYKVNKGNKKLDLSPLYFYYIPILVLFVIVTINGKINIPLEDFKEIISNNFVGEMKEFDFSIYDVFVASVDEKIIIATEAMDKMLFVRIAMTFLILIPELIFIAHLFKKYIKDLKSIKDKILVIIICGSCFAPLTSIFAGYDFFRWVGHFIICIVVVLISMYLNDKDFRDMVYTTIRNNKLIVLALGIANLCLGPYIALRSYLLIEEIVRFILAK